jgi:DNA-binding response OmpR family regulator
MNDVLISIVNPMARHSKQEVTTSLRIVMLTDLQVEVKNDVEHLHEQGYIVKTATNLNEISTVTELPDLFILNFAATNIDKFAMVEEIRRKSQAVGVLLVLSIENQEDRVRAFLSGADNYLLRPYEVEELLAIVGSMKRRLRR